MHVSFSVIFDCLPYFYQLRVIGSLCIFDVGFNSVIQKSASLPKTFKMSYAVSVNSAEEDDILVINDR